MKRRMALSLCLLFLFTLVGCNSYALTEEEEIQRAKETQIAAQALNENSDFDSLKLLQPYEGSEEFSNPLMDGSSGANSIGGEGYGALIETLQDEEGIGYLRGSYWFYPRTTENIVLTSIAIFPSGINCNTKEYPYHVFGIKPGTILQDAVTLLESNGYARQKIEGPYETYKNAGGKRRTIMRNADILVMLDCEVVDGPVDTITIQVFDGREKPKNPGYVY